MSLNLTDYTVLSFDCYGTLIDWEAGIVENLKPLTDKLGSVAEEDKILETHAIYEARVQAKFPSMKYSQLLAEVYKQIAAEWGIAINAEDSVVYGNSVGAWPVFGDSVRSLKILKEHFQLAILSNVDNSSFSKSNKRLEVEFDYIFTAEDVGSYKPNPRNFEFMLQNLSAKGISRHQVLHVAESLFHDHVPANQFEIDNCWIYRRHQKEGFGATKTPEKMPAFKFQFNSLEDFAEAVQE